jgi:maltooligosyltrehalose trehalohydrolase
MDGGVHFRVWAPGHERVRIVLDDRELALDCEDGAYFSGWAAHATRYRIRVDDAEPMPDPASRFQPEGPHGPSEVIDPAFDWREWRGVSRRHVVLYELHVGTFTKEGTYAAAIEHLDALADAGINVIEMMPIHEFPGAFGWGYDGVDLYAPYHGYGRPDELRRLVDEAHARGISVILDVVYNHFGPDGCYLRTFTPHYFTTRYVNDWGDAINFDGPESRGVREFFTENAAYWIDEFHFDGLRLDATQSIFDASEPHILAEIVASARRAANGREILIVGENEPQDARLLREYGLDMLWNDDWHHAARVAATGHVEAYYTDYRGRAQEFVSMAKLGFLYQGQRYKWQKNRRGTPSHDLPPERLVCFLDNHDQVANSAAGLRVHQITSPGRCRALTALLLLQPQTPMLFQGQEFGAPSPFLYFADHKPELAQLVREGRLGFMKQFPSVREIAPPESHETFERCKLDHAMRDDSIVALHRDLLRLRREPPFDAQRVDWMHGALLGDTCFLFRWLTGGEDDRLLLINLGTTLQLDPAPEPLLAPPAGFTKWHLHWSTEPMPEPEMKDHWQIAGESAALLRP